MPLSHTDFDALQRAILELYEPGNFEAFKQRLLRIVHQIIPADAFTPCSALDRFGESDPHHLTINTTAPGPGFAASGLGRNSKGFTERDRLMLNLLRPHVIQAGRIAELLEQRAQAGDGDGSSQVRADKFGLSPRECEVAQWVAQGKTNPEIAIILGTSARTIEKHMEKILDKLRVENRTAVAALLARGRPRTHRRPARPGAASRKEKGRGKRGLETHDS